jgi:DNA-directed RNA polymerase specialized sigma24 family protein
MGVESDEEFRDFMQSRWSAMVRLRYTLTGDQGHAEDIAQAAFSSAYSAWGRVRRAGDPDAYVRAIVIYENSKRFRKQRVREDLRPPSRNAALALTTAWPTGRRCATR